MATHIDQPGDTGERVGEGARALAEDATTPLSRKGFLGGAAKVVAGAAAAGTALGAAPALAAGSRHLPEIMRKGNPVTLTYYFGANPAEAQTRQKLFNQFMAANPDIKIVNQIDSTVHLQKFNTEVAGGTPPDLTMSWELDYSAYAKRGVYMDLKPFIARDSQFQHTVMSQQYPALLDMFTFEGHLYVLPEQVTDTVLYYNKDHVAAAGLKMPTSWTDKTWTWDKFQTYAQKLTQRRGSRITRYGYAEMWGWPLTACNVVAAANGGNWFNRAVNPGAGASNLADPKISRAIQWYADLTNVHKVAASNATVTTTPGFQLFQTGRASMGISGHWFYPAFSGTSGLHFDVAPIPIGPDGDSYSRTNVGGTGISISAKTKYPEQCWRFVKFWAGVQGQQGVAQSGLFVPALKNVGQSSAYTRSNSALEHATIFTDILSQGHVHSLPISRAWPEFSIPWTNVLVSQIWQGTRSAAQALPALDKTINADIQKYG
jgi:multiple sugar transport system substrate-binding protein